DVLLQAFSLVRDREARALPRGRSRDPPGDRALVGDPQHEAVFSLEEHGISLRMAAGRQAADRSAGAWPRRARTRSITSPTTLFGVEAPAVSPRVTRPSGSQSGVSTSLWAPTRRWRIASPSRQSGLLMWKVRSRSAQM